jgi:hypothetical protein
MTFERSEASASSRSASAAKASISPQGLDRLTDIKGNRS